MDTDCSSVQQNVLQTPDPSKPSKDFTKEISSSRPEVPKGDTESSTVSVKDGAFSAPSVKAVVASETGAAPSAVVKQPKRINFKTLSLLKPNTGKKS